MNAFLIGCSGILLVCSVVVLTLVYRAPEGREDKDGFHYTSPSAKRYCKKAAQQRNEFRRKGWLR